MGATKSGVTKKKNKKIAIIVISIVLVILLLLGVGIGAIAGICILIGVAIAIASGGITCSFFSAIGISGVLFIGGLIIYPPKKVYS